jgi:hypothetical protein
MNVDGIIRDLRAQRDRLDNAIAALEGGNGRRRRSGRRRRMSPAARRRISAAMKARWAERRKKTA